MVFGLKLLLSALIYLIYFIIVSMLMGVGTYVYVLYIICIATMLTLYSADILSYLVVLSPIVAFAGLKAFRFFQNRYYMNKLSKIVTKKIRAVKGVECSDCKSLDIIVKTSMIHNTICYSGKCAKCNSENMSLTEEGLAMFNKMEEEGVVDAE